MKVTGGRKLSGVVAGKGGDNGIPQTGRFTPNLQPCQAYCLSASRFRWLMWAAYANLEYGFVVL